MRTLTRHDASSLLSNRHGEPARAVLAVLVTAMPEERVVRLLCGELTRYVGRPLRDVVGPSHVADLGRALDLVNGRRPADPNRHRQRRLSEIRKNVTSVAR